MANRKLLQQKRVRRANRSRAKLFGTASRPRLSIFRSNKFTYVQLIDDENGKTLASSSSREISSKKKESKVEEARLLGQEIAKKAVEIGVESAVFDRGRYKYHGRVSAVAEGAKEKGLKI